MQGDGGGREVQDLLYLGDPTSLKRDLWIHGEELCLALPPAELRVSLSEPSLCALELNCLGLNPYQPRDLGRMTQPLVLQFLFL